MQAYRQYTWTLKLEREGAIHRCRQLVEQSDGYLEVWEGIDTISFRGKVPSDHPVVPMIGVAEREFDLRMGWHEYAEFTQAEIDQAELLKCFPTNYATQTPPSASGTVYETIIICERCQLRRREQRSPLRLRRTNLQGLKISKTIGDDTYLLSPELAALFRHWGVSGCSLAEVRDSGKGAQSGLVQLVPTWTLPDLAPSTPFTVAEDVLCPACGRMGRFPLVLHYRREDVGEIQDVGFAPVYYSMNFSAACYLTISQRLYRLLRANRVRGYRVEPILLV